MRKFKLHKGVSPIYDLTVEEYEKRAPQGRPYKFVGKDNEMRRFAICPACDNPIQIIGIYKKCKNTDKPYGKHYNRNTEIGIHNEQAYQYCPYRKRITKRQEINIKQFLRNLKKVFIIA